MADTRHIGIDLGTSTSGLAWLKSDGTPEMVPNSDGERLTPSVIYFDPTEGVKLVGSAARIAADPERTVYFIKRHMDDPKWTFEADDRKWTPAEISALILAKLKRDGSNQIGEINEVVLTVPANFNDLARQATIAAAKIAGLRVVRLVNEPTAAALYYAQTYDVSGRVLVFDLGGGTLDITILDIEPNHFRILLSEGARHLGGSNFDDIILELFADHFRASTGSDLLSDEESRLRALQTGEDAKIMLSKLRQVTDVLHGTETSSGAVRVQLTREVFEEAVGRLLTRSIMLVEQALTAAGIGPDGIEHVLMVGGSTRIPRVKELLAAKFGFEPLTCPNVDECVALGAALFSAQSATVDEVCNHGYGILALIENIETGETNFQNSVVIPKNTQIPCSETQTYYTSEDDEDLIEVEITQGEDTDPRYVDIVGKVVLTVPKGRKAGCEVTVTYHYDENQRVRVEVLDKESGESKEVEVQYEGEGVLSDKDIERKSAYLKQIRIE